MKVRLLPDRFDVECETEDDWSALVAWWMFGGRCASRRPGRRCG